MTARQKVWVSRPLFPEVLARLAEHLDVDAEAVERRHEPEQLRERLAGVDAAIIGLADPVNAAVVEGNRRLRVIANLAVGYNNLDVPALTRAGILACNTPDVLNETVADYAWALMLGAARRVGTAERWLRAGQWQGGMRFDDWLGVDVHGKTLGILGFGRIGQAVARRAALGFGMQVLYHNPRRVDVPELAGRAMHLPLDEVLARADIVAATLPLTDQTRGMLGAREFALMKPGAIFVNGGRGATVQEPALLAALDSGHLRAAALDVFAKEPVPLDNPLRTHPKVTPLPHIGSATHETRHAMAELATTNLLRALAGERPPAVYEARP
jgi:gluconate 2-dehydrogenase